MKHNKEYFRIHNWLIYWHGRATKCENEECTFKNPKRFEWALKKGFKYERNPNNFIKLCCSCHRKYDFTEETRMRMSKSRKGQPAKNKRAVILNGVRLFPSISEAAQEMEIQITSISNNLKGLSKSTKVGIWKYEQVN